MTEEREKRDRTKEFLGGRKGVGRWGDNQGITMREGGGVTGELSDLTFLR